MFAFSFGRPAPALALVLSLVLLCAAGCGVPLIDRGDGVKETVVCNLMQCPNVYQTGEDAFADVPPVYQVNPVPVFYFSDRKAETAPDGANLEYTAKRDRTIDFGETRVRIGGGLDWEGLKAVSLTPGDRHRPAVSVASVRRLVEYPAEIGGVTRKEMADKTGDPDAYDKAVDKAAAGVMDALGARLDQVARKEVFIFVNGVNTTFAQSMTDWTQVWHYLGREGVPLIFSWPSGHNGIKTYFIDSDAGDTSAEYLKKMVQLLASFDKVEKVSIIGHSRGCDITCRALLSLAEINTAQGKKPGEGLKLNNVLLLAPDVDINFFGYRVVENGVLEMPRMFTIFMSDRDKALSVSRWLRAGIKRLGGFSVKELTAADFSMSRFFPNTHTVVSEAKPANWLNHSYYLESASVSSDLVKILRYELRPGASNGRPLRMLRNEDSNLWALDEGYPFQQGQGAGADSACADCACPN